ncbi:hypothetical protein [Actinoplanes subglobosus]|uniref:Uncharacterized protein n=1 Tax=Actinoplanes subglobosus TaxID=1547892 RepID=A0ABV8JC54_9ACTN
MSGEKVGTAVAVFGAAFLTLFTAAFLLGGGPEYWKFALFVASLIVLSLSVVVHFSPDSLHLPRLAVRVPADPGPSVSTARITPFIRDVQLRLLSELPMVSPKSRGRDTNGSAT